ncbi:MAG: Ni/Fe hydrogenase subunit gamma [Caldilineaceae bacterium]|nr:Ni/Fe hydrogenase subunit gamma [Caldilineaceae bacterium]
MELESMVSAADPMLPLPYTVRERVKENEDTFTVELEPASGDILPAFRAGQFNMLYILGIGEIPISLSGDPAKPYRLIHTTRAVGSVTGAMSNLREGDMLGVRGPFGSCWPMEQMVGRDVVIVAGGIGLAPLRPALYQMLESREQFGKIVLLYGARTQEEMLFRRELEQWRARFDLEVHVTVDRATAPKGRTWQGNVGVVTTLIPRAPFDPLESVALICGPETMMRFTVQALQRRGVTTDHIYVSMERNMQCAVGFCGHCQYGPYFVCRDGPVFRFDQLQPLFGKWEV